MHRFKEIANKIIGASIKNTYDGLCYILCCILLVVFIIALLIIPFASLPENTKVGSSEADAKASQSTEAENESTTKQVGAPVNADGTEETSGATAKESEMIFPLDGRITSKYGWRNSPVSTSSEYTFHHGIDVSASKSDVILSYKSGTVTETGYSNSYGYYILISHGTHDSFYAHCDTVYVSVGDIVKCGEIIAKAGDTGRATGKHLHFEIRINGTAVDPLEYVTPDEDQT